MRTTCKVCGNRSRTCNAAGVCASCVVHDALALARVGPPRCEYGGMDEATHRLTWPMGSTRVVCLDCAASICQTALLLQGIELTVERLEPVLPN